MMYVLVPEYILKKNGVNADREAGGRIRERRAGAIAGRRGEQGQVTKGRISPIKSGAAVACFKTMGIRPCVIDETRR